jgi:two-component system nitrate/nitrite response regulator NarL
MAEIRVLIVASDPLARAGLAALLDGQAECTVVGQVAAEGSLAEMVDVYRPDAVVWDLGWGRGAEPEEAEPLADLEEIQAPILILLADEARAPQAWAAGVRGLLSREATAEVLAASLRVMVLGLAVLDPTLAPGLLASRDRASGTLVEELTPRELEVLQLLAEGLSNKAIAHRLGISDHTVKFHVNAILGKLGAQGRTDAVVRAARLGLLIL